MQRGVVEAAGQPVGAREPARSGVEARVAARGGGELGDGLEQREVVLPSTWRGSRVADPEHAAQLLAPLERVASEAWMRSNGEPAGSAAMLW